MNNQQQNAIDKLYSGNISNSKFLQVYGIDEKDIPAEVSRLLNQAIHDQDSETVEDAFMLGFTFAFPDDILDLIHILLIKDWHISHENMISILQTKADPTSIHVLKQAIELKPDLEYLNYDDYGAYYKKCIYALRDIDTPEAISVIKECACSSKTDLKKQAEYRLQSIKEF